MLFPTALTIMTVGAVFLLAQVPSFSDEIDAVQKVGFPIVIALLFFGSFVAITTLVIRQLLTYILKRIDEAINLFQNMLRDIHNDQTEALNRSTEAHAQALDRFAEKHSTAMGKLTDILQKQTEQMAANNETIRILLTFVTQTQSELNRLSQILPSVPTVTVKDPTTIEIKTPEKIDGE